MQVSTLSSNNRDRGTTNPPKWDATWHTFSFIATHLYCRVERGIVKVGGLAPEHITMTLAKV